MRLFLLFIFAATLLISLEGAARQPYLKNYAKSSASKHSTNEKMENELVRMINEVRAEQGLLPLIQRNELVLCARQHSENMAKKIVSFSHDGFDERAEQMKKVLKLKSFGENVAYSLNYGNPLKTALKGWMNSPGHKKNILGNFNATGIGIAYNKDGYCYITQLFTQILN